MIMTNSSSTGAIERWPELPWEPWKETAATLHMWTQIVGKIRMVQTPWINHSWHVTLYVSPRGLTTSAIPYGERTFQIDFDFIRHELLITTCDNESRIVPLEPQTTADFYSQVMQALRELDLEVEFYARPNEVEEAIPFAEDRVRQIQQVPLFLGQLRSGGKPLLWAHRTRAPRWIPEHAA
jgi:hypothetical protein